MAMRWASGRATSAPAPLSAPRPVYSSRGHAAAMRVKLTSGSASSLDVAPPLRWTPPVCRPLIISVSRWRILRLSADLSTRALTDVLQAASTLPTPRLMRLGSDLFFFLEINFKSCMTSRHHALCFFCSLVFVMATVFNTFCA